MLGIALANVHIASHFSRYYQTLELDEYTQMAKKVSLSQSVGFVQSSHYREVNFLVSVIIVVVVAVVEVEAVEAFLVFAVDHHQKLQVHIRTCTCHDTRSNVSVVRLAAVLNLHTLASIQSH